MFVLTARSWNHSGMSNQDSRMKGRMDGWVIESSDAGLTWSEPRNITSSLWSDKWYGLRGSADSAACFPPPPRHPHTHTHTHTHTYCLSSTRGAGRGFPASLLNPPLPGIVSDTRIEHSTKPLRHQALLGGLGRR